MTCQNCGADIIPCDHFDFGRGEWTCKPKKNKMTPTDQEAAIKEMVDLLHEVKSQVGWKVLVDKIDKILAKHTKGNDHE